MKHLFSAARKHRSLIAVYLLMGLAHTFMQSFNASYFQKVIDNFAGGSLTGFNIAVYGSVMVAQYLVCYAANYPERKLDNGILLSLKTAALRKMATIDYLSYIGLGTGTLIQRIENGASAGKNMLFGFYIQLGFELIPAMLFSMVFVFQISRQVAAAILLGYVFVFVITKLLLRFLYRIKESILVNEEKLNHFLVRGFMELLVFRVNRRFARETEKAEQAAGEIVSSKVRMTLIHEAFFTIFAVLVAFVKIGIILYGWTAGTLSIGQIVALVALVDNAYQPIAIINVIYVDYKLDKIAFARYADFLDAKDDAGLNRGRVLEKVYGNISLKDVGFAYNGRKIFDELNLNIRKGGTTAFVGESGSGKSTAVKLIAGLLHPDEGRVELDGIDLCAINLNSYYGHIAYLPQEPAVFDGSLRENLVFDEEAGDAELIRALTYAGLGGLFGKLENGLDTQLGERGVSLSGGERQQLALARLWFSKAEIVILDEATSAIDNLTEESVMKNVMALLEGKTVVAIAHRLDSIKHFDNIIMFQNGTIAEQGRFGDLTAKRGSFYELYNRG